MPDTIYDVAIIGSGPAGYTAAIRAGQYGLKTALIEKDGFLGGTCLHVGCIPTKALLFNAELWDHLKDAKEFGIEGVDARKLNWAAIQDRKNKIVAKHTKGLEFLMKKNKVETIKGYGKLTGPAQNGVHTVEVTNDGKVTQLKAKNVILATGSEARMIPGLEASDRVLTNIEILSLKEIPKSLVIVGAGAVGVEFASIYRSFDCEVTIVEMLPRLVPVEDEEVSQRTRPRLPQARHQLPHQRESRQSRKDESRSCRHHHRRRQAAENRSRKDPDRHRPQAAHPEHRPGTHQNQARPRVHQNRFLDADRRARRLRGRRHRPRHAATGARRRHGSSGRRRENRR